MIEHILDKIHRNSKGFTLIELAVGMAISGLIITGLVRSFHQLSFFPAEVRADSVVMQQAQNLSFWINRDVQMAQTISIGDDSGTVENEAFTFSWVNVKRTDSQGNDCIDTFCVRYVIDNTMLLRYEDLHTDSYNSGGGLIGSTDSQKTVAISEHVSGIDGALNSASLTVSAAFSFGDAQLSRTYDITPRAYIYILN